MNYRSYRTLMLIAVLLLAGIAASLAVQPQSAKVVSAITPAEDMYLNAYFIADNTKYVIAVGGGGGELIANGDEFGPWASFRVHHQTTKDVFALQACNDQYIGVDVEGGTLIANRDLDTAEKFLMVRVKTTGKIALKTRSNNKFVSAEGGVLHVINSDQIGPWEMFWIQPFHESRSQTTHF